MTTGGRGRLGLLLAITGLALGLAACEPSFTPVKVDFTTQNVALPSGYVRDYGLAYDDDRSYGWIAQTSSTPTSIVNQGRDRNSVSDQRFDTIIHMQVPKQARWEQAVPDGTYNVTVAAGDAIAFDSVHEVTAETTKVVDNFIPTSDDRFVVRTASVTVSDGRLTLDSAGGTNTKLAWVEITASSPFIAASEPKALARGVDKTTAISMTLSEAVDPATVDTSSVQLRRTNGTLVTGTYNVDGASASLTFAPANPLVAFTTYTLTTTSVLKTANGVSYAPFTSTFTTDDGGTPPAGLTLSRTSIGGLTAPTSVTVGPDGKLYVASALGEIRRWDRDVTGLPTGSPTLYTPFEPFTRTITGIRFDPAATATNRKLWISHGVLGNEDVPNFTGKVSVVTIPQSGTNVTPTDVITGLPRSVRDHLNNGIDFGTDGRLYLAQGSINGYGAPDAAWGFRAETPLSAAILVADVNSPSFPATVDVDTSAGYNPDASGAPVTRYASGTRNAFDLVWHPDGRLYATVNESASGNTPAGPGNNPPALTNLPAGNDFLARVDEDGYHGHPNPSIGNYVLNGGNPTSSIDPWEVAQYPVGTAPEPDWNPPIHNFGYHRSPNGITVYQNGAFSGALQDRLLTVEFSGGDDLLAITLTPSGTVSAVSQVALGFLNPLDVHADAATGAIYVLEYGNTDDGSEGALTTLRP